MGLALLDFHLGDNELAKALDSEHRLLDRLEVPPRLDHSAEGLNPRYALFDLLLLQFGVEHPQPRLNYD